MQRRSFLALLGAALTSTGRCFASFVPPAIKVSLGQAHKGTLEIDTQLLDSYGGPPKELRALYFDVRRVFAENSDADFSHPDIIAAAKKHGAALLGGPILGRVQADGVTIWVRPASTQLVSVRIADREWSVAASRPGAAVQIEISGLSAGSHHEYDVSIGGERVAGGSFTTPAEETTPSTLRIAFGSCCHKIGIHNPNLFGQIVNRQTHAMMLLGDIAVDDRNNEVNMHRADYQLRDVSTPWRNLAAHVPLFASWDDHDYFDNDRSGIPKRYTAKDRDAVRGVYRENWNNPETPEQQEGIYFRHRIGPVEIIMLDTRSCRDAERRNSYGAYLGDTQMDWLKKTLKNSTAPFKIISSGTMWSDYVSKAKDSWGSWDKEGREEIFDLIESEKIGGVLLVSGDRHGARAFRIPRPSGFAFHEFEPATLGGVPGPAGKVKDCPEQLFGYDGRDFIACGEFTFETSGEEPAVTFRLIRESGEIVQEHQFSLSTLTPK